MADRYWVGVGGAWNTTSTANWSASSGGASGASVPTALDNVFFDQAGTYTVTCSGLLNCANLTVSAGTVTFASGTSPTFNIYGSLSLVTGTVWSSTGAITFRGTAAGNTIVTNGVVFAATVTIATASGSYALAGAFQSSNSFIVTIGTFDTASYSLTASSFASNSSSTRSVSFGASSITLSGAANFLDFTTSTGLTFNAGTSTITSTSVATSSVSGSGQTLYALSISGQAVAFTLNGFPSITTFSVGARTSLGTSGVVFPQDVTIGTLTTPAQVDATRRLFLRSNVVGTPRTLTVGTFTPGSSDIDFRDIVVAGAAAPISGTRFSDCKGNSGVTFPAGVNKYWNLAGGGTVQSAAWATTSGGAVSVNNFPLAQDTMVFEATGLNSGATVTINATWTFGTIDMSARTSNTMTFAMGTQTPTFCGNWINGTGTTISGTGTITFAGRNSQTITSAGRTFTVTLSVDSPGGTVSLQDALTTTKAGTALSLVSGTFDANNYNITLPSSVFASSNSNIRTLKIGSGTWVIGGIATAWNVATSTNLTVTGTGTISMTSASSKTFAGGGIQTYPTLNQGGTGQLTVSGSNKFAGLTNTAIGSIQFTGGTTNEFSSFTISGAPGNLLPLGSTNTTQAILKKPTAWNMGLLSTDAGNNTGLNFLSTDGTMEYLSVSYINGTVTAGNYTLAANNGTYALSGQVATISKSRILIAGNGTYTLSGQSASITAGRLFVADAGQYSLNGQDAIITLGGSPIVVSDQLLIELRSFTERRRF